MQIKNHKNKSSVFSFESIYQLMNLPMKKREEFLELNIIKKMGPESSPHKL